MLRWEKLDSRHPLHSSHAEGVRIPTVGMLLLKILHTENYNQLDVWKQGFKLANDKLIRVFEAEIYYKT